MKIKHPINLHKATTGIVIFGLMFLYHNFTIGPWVYLALHGSYGILWLIKDRLFPDKRWEQELSIPMTIATFLMLAAYWVAPFVLIQSGFIPPAPLVAAAISVNVIGVFLAYGSDAQKHYTLKYKSGLITEGFFARTRNPNYLGELLIYLSFALLVWHWIPFLIVAGFTAGVWVPNMLQKDRSLSRYPEFVTYKANSGLFFPKLFGSQTEIVAAPDRTSTAKM